MKFKAASMTDFYSESDKPDFYTVLCKVEGGRKGWSYCGDGKGNIIKVATLKEAKEISAKIKLDYLAKLNEAQP